MNIVLKNYAQKNFGLPTRFLNPWDLPFISKLTETDSTNSIFSQIRVWTSTDPATAVFSCGELLLALLLDFHCCFSHELFPPDKVKTSIDYAPICRANRALRIKLRFDPVRPSGRTITFYA
jgi:hypothetical protein